MTQKNNKEDLFPKGFFKQFKNKENFQEYFNSLFKQGLKRCFRQNWMSILVILNMPKMATTRAIVEMAPFPKPLPQKTLAKFC